MQVVDIVVLFNCGLELKWIIAPVIHNIAATATKVSISGEVDQRLRVNKFNFGFPVMAMDSLHVFDVVIKSYTGHRSEPR